MVLLYYFLSLHYFLGVDLPPIQKYILLRDSLLFFYDHLFSALQTAPNMVNIQKKLLKVFNLISVKQKYRKWFSIQLLKVFQNPLITYTQESLNTSSSSSLSLSLHLPFIGLSAEHVLHLSSFNSHNLFGISHFPFYK